MRKRQLAAWSVLFIVALMLLGGCTQLDSPEKVAHALMSIVLPPPDAEAEPSPTEAIALNQTTAISTTATPLEANVAETATPALVVSTTVPLAQTAVATVGAENAESAAPDETEVLTVGELRTRQATTQQPLTETVELTDTQAISGAVSISSTLSMSDTLSVPSSELVSDTESVTDTLSITGTVPVTSAVPVTGTAMVAPTTSVSATVDVRTVGDVAATVALAKAQQLVTIVTDGSRLNVRSEAANDAAIVGKLTPDAVVEVLDSTADAAWLQVAFDEAGATGWIAAQFTQPVESESSVANGQLVSAANSPSDDEPVAPIVLAPTEVTSTMTTSVSVTTSVSITGALPITSSKALTSSVVVTPASSGAVTSTLLATLSLTEALQSTIAVAPTEPTAITKPANMNVRSGRAPIIQWPRWRQPALNIRFWRSAPMESGIRLSCPMKKSQPGCIAHWWTLPAPWRKCLHFLKKRFPSRRNR
ncbi:MAG: SH3 domain-containing protein [Caldilineaceae bacterium]|nr:SH3 domain-containing protein [Caldilineaceae bacterium]